MPKIYPTSTELSAWLTAAGFTAGTLDLTVAAAHGRFEFERAAGRKMYEPSSGDRFFDPPGGPGYLPLDEDLDSSAAPVVVYQPTGAAAETLVAGTDYRLRPYSADPRDVPYHGVEFYRRWPFPLTSGYRRSLKITGNWGYSASGFPEDVFDAMLKFAAASLCGQKGFSLSSGYAQTIEAGVNRTWGADPISGAREAWLVEAARIAAAYRRVRI